MPQVAGKRPGAAAGGSAGRVSGGNGKGSGIEGGAELYMKSSLCCMMGRVVQVKLVDGSKWDGVLANVKVNNGQMDIILQMARKSALCRTEYIETKKIDGKDLLTMYIPHVDLESKSSGALESRGQQHTFRTDTQISGGVRGGERVLQAWKPDKEDQELLGSLEELGTSSDGGSWDQFATNQKLTGKKSTYKEDLYSTKLDKTSAFYKKNIQSARALAANITKKKATSVQEALDRGQQVDMDEEDLYSTVLDDPNAAAGAGGDAKKAGKTADESAAVPPPSEEGKEEAAAGVPDHKKEEENLAEVADDADGGKKEKKKKKKKGKFSKNAKAFTPTASMAPTPSTSPPPHMAQPHMALAGQYPFPQQGMQPYMMPAQLNQPPLRYPPPHPGAAGVAPRNVQSFGGGQVFHGPVAGPGGLRMVGNPQQPVGLHPGAPSPHYPPPQPSGFEQLITPAQRPAGGVMPGIMPALAQFQVPRPGAVPGPFPPQRHQQQVRRGSNPGPPLLHGQPPRGPRVAAPPGQGQGGVGAPPRNGGGPAGQGSQGSAPLLPTPDPSSSFPPNVSPNANPNPTSSSQNA